MKSRRRDCSRRGSLKAGGAGTANGNAQDSSVIYRFNSFE
jgi:hypothetical protein